VPILVVLAYLGGAWALLGVMVPVIIGTLEMFAMLQGAGFRPLVPAGVALAAAFVLDGAFAEYRVIYAALPVGAILTLGWLAFRSDPSNAIADWALTLVSAVYVGGLLQFFLPLRAMPEGLVWVLMVLVATWFCDSTAYFVGRAAGRTKLAPRISPAKSVEGALAGVAAAVLIGLVAAAMTGLPYWRMAGLGLVIGVCAVVGDLLESFIKRQCGAKDSGALVPGHGGMLDRMDSLLLSVAGGYLFVVATA
jgi:phosphatidate cytidylyltransferase